MAILTLQWRHNDHDGASNHQPHGCLLHGSFRRRSKKTSKLRVTGLCGGDSPGPVNSSHKGPVTRKMFPFDDVIMNPSSKMETYLMVNRVWCAPGDMYNHLFVIRRLLLCTFSVLILVKAGGLYSLWIVYGLLLEFYSLLDRVKQILGLAATARLFTMYSSALAYGPRAPTCGGRFHVDRCVLTGDPTPTPHDRNYHHLL